jgi:superfamily II DNA or RNA helicase
MNNNVVVKTPMDMLLQYQVPHVQQLYECFQSINCALDASDTGTGKTYTSMALCHLLKLKPFIICPKSVINTWINVAKAMNVEILGLSNYEKLKGCKYYTPNFEMTECPYIDKIGDEKTKYDFVFQLPSDTIIIADEAHKCKNSKTANSKMLVAMKDSGCKILLLSATITDKIECFRPFGVMFGLYDNTKKYTFWIKNKLRVHFVKATELMVKHGMTQNDVILKIIHNSIFPNRGSRMKIKELGDMFPQNQVLAKCYYSDDHEQVNEIYGLINTALDDLKTKEKKSFALGEIVRCRMRIEMLKLPIILDLIDDALDNNYSVAVFVNFKDSMNYLAHHLKEDCSIICGDQSVDERTYNIENFQSNKTKIIISIIQAGGVGISLHDLHGRPRMSIISPSWSGTDVVQCLGRIHRAGSKSPALQRIVYIAKTYEEEICKTLGEKLVTLSAINDGDLVGPKIMTERLKEMGELDVVNKSVINVDYDSIDTETKELSKNKNNKEQKEINIDQTGGTDIKEINFEELESDEDVKLKKKNDKKTVKKKKFVVITNDEPSDFNKKDKQKNFKDDDDDDGYAKLGTKYKLKK